MQKLQPPAVRKQTQHTTHIHPDLCSSQFVFVRHDGVKKSLQPPYNRPFKVLKRSSKHFTLDIAGQEKVVSLDRLKPAYLDTPQPTPTDTLPQAAAHASPQTLTSSSSSSATSPSTTTRTTRSGRHVHWPKRLANFYSFT